MKSKKYKIHFSYGIFADRNTNLYFSLFIFHLNLKCHDKKNIKYITGGTCLHRPYLM